MDQWVCLKCTNFNMAQKLLLQPLQMPQKGAFSLVGGGIQWRQ